MGNCKQSTAKMSTAAQLVEEVLCPVDELQINEKRLFTVGTVKVLLIRESSDRFASIGNLCSHYGAPLINGAYHDGFITCPWHAATFSTKTGDIEEFPGCDNIPVYENFIRDSNVVVKVPTVAEKKCVKAKVPRNIQNRSTIVILGGGPAGFQCSETLRQQGYDGRIVLVSSESVPPYDRTKLSKALTVNVDDILLRDREQYKKHGIELVLDTKCTKVDIESKVVHLDNGSTLFYEKLFIATGSDPRKFALLDDVKNVNYLRTYKDAAAIANDSKDQHVVLLGSSFIVMEIAAYLSGKCASVSIISRSDVPFAASLGKKIGKRIRELFVSKQIAFHVVPEFLKSEDITIVDGKLTKIRASGVELQVDLCVVGIGSTPNTDFILNSEIKLDNRFIVVDKCFKTSQECIYAGGDCVIYPNRVFDDQQMNIAHWQTAQAHGKYAALAMLGKTSGFLSVPFFWSVLFGKGIRFCGHVEDPENVIIEGTLEELSFVAMYFDSANRLVAVATMANDPIASAFSHILRKGKKITKQEIESEGLRWYEDLSKIH